MVAIAFDQEKNLLYSALSNGNVIVNKKSRDSTELLFPQRDSNDVFDNSTTPFRSMQMSKFGVLAAGSNGIDIFIEGKDTDIGTYIEGRVLSLKGTEDSVNAIDIETGVLLANKRGDIKFKRVENIETMAPAMT